MLDVPLSALAALSLLLSPAVSAARDPLSCEMKAASEKLRDCFSGRRIKELSMGEVTNVDSTWPSSSPTSRCPRGPGSAW